MVPMGYYALVINKALMFHQNFSENTQFVSISPFKMVFCSSAVKKQEKLKTVSKWKTPGMFNSENVEVNGFIYQAENKKNCKTSQR